MAFFHSFLLLYVYLQFVSLPFFIYDQTHSHNLDVVIRLVPTPSGWLLKICSTSLVSSIQLTWPIQFGRLTLMWLTMSTPSYRVCNSWLCLIRHWLLLYIYIYSSIIHLICAIICMWDFLHYLCHAWSAGISLRVCELKYPSYCIVRVAKLTKFRIYCFK